MDAIILYLYCCSFVVDSVIIVLLVVSWRRITFACALTAADFTRVGYPWQFHAAERSIFIVVIQVAIGSTIAAQNMTSRIIITQP